MTSKTSDATPTDSAPHTTRTDRISVKKGLMTVATGFVLFFLMGFVSAWLQSEGDLMALVMRGLKFGASGSIGVGVGVICNGISAAVWQRLPVPAWLPSTASFAVGLSAMHGLGEVFDGRYENILPKAGGGFFSGAIVGVVIYWVQTKGQRPQGTSGTSERSASTGSGK